MAQLEYLRAFEQAVRTGSFTAAAHRLGISRPAVSKSIAQLEMQLGTRLFNRTTRQLHLTAEGRSYFEKISAGLTQLDEATEMLRESRKGPVGLVRAASLTLFGKYYIVPLLPAFFAKYPKVDLEISFDDTTLDLVREGLDVGIVRGSKEDSSVVSRHLYHLQIFLVASPAYLRAYGIPKSPADLKSHQLLNVRLPSGELPLWEFERVNERGSKARRSERVVVEPRGRVVVASHFDAVNSCALAGLGIAASHFGAVESHLAAGELKVVLPGYRVLGLPKEGTDIYIRYPHRDYLPLKVRVLVDFLIEHFSDREAQRRDFESVARYAVSG